MDLSAMELPPLPDVQEPAQEVPRPPPLRDGVPLTMSYSGRARSHVMLLHTPYNLNSYIDNMNYVLLLLLLLLSLSFLLL